MSIQNPAHQTGEGAEGVAARRPRLFLESGPKYQGFGRRVLKKIQDA
jgi:hypothetical protein